MPICIECCYHVSQLYHVLHSSNQKPTHRASAPNLATGSSSQKPNADGQKIPVSRPKKTRSGGGGDVRLTQCPRCKRFADKYVEHDFVVLFIDLVLVKPQVYRHLLFNRLSRDDDELDPSILRISTILLLFDVYLTWSHIESLPPGLTDNSPIPKLHILLQYGFYLVLCTLTTLSQHLTIRSLAGVWGLGGAGGEDETQSDETQSNDGSPNTNVNAKTSSTAPSRSPPRKPTPNAVSTALFVSSCMSLFPILMVVWKDEEEPSLASSKPTSNMSNTTSTFASGFMSTPGRRVDWVRRGVSWAVAVQNLEALRILLECGYLSAAGLVVAGGAVRWIVRSAILGAVGLGSGG